MSQQAVWCAYVHYIVRGQLANTGLADRNLHAQVGTS